MRLLSFVHTARGLPDAHPIHLTQAAERVTVAPHLRKALAELATAGLLVSNGSSQYRRIRCHERLPTDHLRREAARQHA